MSGPFGVFYWENHDVDSKDLGDELHKFDNKRPLLSLYAIARCTEPKAMWVRPMVGKYELTIIIDSGSTHNFLNQKIAQTLRLVVTPIEEFVVRVVNRRLLPYHWMS